MRNVEESAIARQTERRDDFRHEIDHLRSAVMKVEPLLYGDRKVYSVAGFNRGVADWLSRLPTLWIEGEVTELRRNDRWGSVFFTLKDPEDGACLPASIPRRTFDALKLDLARRRADPRARPGRAVRGEGRVPAAGALAGAVRARCAPGCDRAAEAGARGGGHVRRVAQACPPALPAADRARHRQRRRRPPRRDHHDPDPLPARARARRRDPRPGPAGRGGDRRGDRGRQPRAGDRRRHPHPRRRQLRRPAPVQRRERRACRRRPARCRSSRPSGTSRTRRCATSPRTCARRPRPRRASSSSPTWRRSGRS